MPQYTLDLSRYSHEGITDFRQWNLTPDARNLTPGPSPEKRGRLMSARCESSPL
jgi:hypothetical protein